VSRQPAQVQPPLDFIAPNLDLTTVRLTYTLLPLWMRWKTALKGVEVDNLDRLVDLYQQFQAKRVRILFAFRHPSVDDPICLGYTVGNLFPKMAKRMGVKLSDPVHAHFMYDRGIPLWAGNMMGQLYSKLGGTPIMRGKVDRMGLRSARNLFANGRFPLMAAPEGGTNGHSEVVSPLEPGIAQFGFWCAEDLQKASRTEEVVIVPIGIQYRYMTPPWAALEQLLQQLEQDCGLPQVTYLENDTLDENLYRRLYRLGEHLLTVMETYYRRFYRHEFQEAIALEGDANELLSKRLQALMNAALTVAEEYFGLPGRGSTIDRCRRLEQAAWDLIYREDLNLENLAPLERGLADRIAEEATLRLWHMRLVESFVAVTGKYVREKMTVERFSETLMLTWEMITKIKGQHPAFDRPKLGAKRGYVTIGEPISVSDRWADYSRDRRSAKQAVATLTQDLQTALEAMIH
jgi:hypothetical protein